jgi:uncharacterized protein VirK/YbjX
MMTVDPEWRESQVSPIKYGYIIGRLSYFLMVILNSKDILLLTNNNLKQLKYLYNNHPEALPSVFWPYQHSEWGLIERLNALYNHFITQAETSELFICGRYSQKRVACLNEFYQGMSLVVDRNGIFMREGMVALNIYIEKERIFTIAFSLIKDEKHELVSVVGAIQGRRMNNITQIYHDITKKMFGLRPRDLAVELFQMICRAINIDKIYAISEACRQQNHYLYRFKDKRDTQKLNYDHVWQERGGVCCTGGFYKLPVTPLRRSIGSVVAKKRSMYKKRYDLLNRIEKKIFSDINELCQKGIRAGCEI